MTARGEQIEHDLNGRRMAGPSYAGPTSGRQIVLTGDVTEIGGYLCGAFGSSTRQSRYAPVPRPGKRAEPWLPRLGPTHSNTAGAGWHSGERRPRMLEADRPVLPEVRAKAGRLAAGELSIEALPYGAADRAGGAGSAHPVLEVEGMVPWSGCGDARPVIGKQAADFREGKRAVVTGVTEAFEPVCLGRYDRVVGRDHVGDPYPAGWPGDAEHLADHGGRIRDLMQREPADHEIELLEGPRQRGRVADQERDVGQALRGGQALTLPQHLRRQIERADMSHARSKTAAELRRA